MTDLTVAEAVKAIQNDLTEEQQKLTFTKLHDVCDANLLLPAYGGRDANEADQQEHIVFCNAVTREYDRQVTDNIEIIEPMKTVDKMCDLYVLYAPNLPDDLQNISADVALYELRQRCQWLEAYVTHWEDVVIPMEKTKNV